MKLLHRLGAVALLIVITACTRSDFQTLSGQSGQFASGDIMLINYWATWCGPCREEIPALNRIDSEYGPSRVLGVNFDDLQGEALKAAIDEMGIEFDSLPVDPAEALGQQRPQVLPTTLVIAADGSVQQVLTGPQTFEDFQRAFHQR